MKRIFYLFAILFFSSATIALAQKEPRYAIYVSKGFTQASKGVNTFGFAYQLKSTRHVWLRANLWFSENSTAILKSETRTTINDSITRMARTTHTAVKQRLNLGIQEIRTFKGNQNFYWVYGVDAGINRFVLTPKVASTDRTIRTRTQNGFTFTTSDFGETTFETKPPVERYLMTLAPHISVGVHLNSHFSLQAGLNAAISYFKKDGSLRHFNEDITLYPLILQYVF
jgi:hypothetical protein